MEEFKSIQEQVGRRIRTVREWRKLTQTELGEKMQREKSYISKIECGQIKRVTVDEISQIAKALEVRKEYLLGMDIIPEEVDAIVSELRKLFRRISTTKTYIPPEYRSYTKQDLLIGSITPECLVLTGAPGLYEFLLTMAKIQGERGLTKKEQANRQKRAKEKYLENQRKNGEEPEKEEQYLVVTLEQLDGIVRNLVSNQGYVDRLLESLNFPPSDE